MLTKFKLLFQVFLYLAFLLTSTAAFACKCKKQTPEELYNNADIIFAGVLNNYWRSNNSDPSWGQFIIEQSYKGTDRKKGDVAVIFEKTGTCITGFKAGEKYIIYAVSRQQNGIFGFIKDRHWYTDSCMGSKLLIYAQDDLEFLDAR
jgi:hypothetical protein